ENEKVQIAIAAAEQRLGNQGRLVIRKSGTEPLIRVMAEGDDAALVQHLVAEIVGVIQSEAALASK
ncbi:MAG: phosphoglucosamine mutase, partial [Pseudomonadota bacterium]|nr:phosphoglucosamine mutase [Pseudomonadota bacterium]